MGKLQVFTAALLGGLQDSKPIPDPGDMQLLSNFSLFRGRFSVRAPLFTTAQLLDDAGSPAPVTQVLQICYHKGKAYALGFSSNTNKTYLYRLNSDCTPEGGGATAAPLVVVWTGATVPKPTMASFDGGAAATPVSRLYCADYTETYDTRYWDSDGSTINTVTEDFNDDGSKENVRYGLIWNFQFHLWGSGFYQSGASRRPELARFSQPGLIPADEPNVTNNITREWWSVDQRSFGRRGDKITNVSYAGSVNIIFKKYETYSLFGYDSDSWAAKQISKQVGCVGQWASAYTEDGLCFFWSANGPHVTDGEQVIDIGEDIRKHIQELGQTDDVSTGYSSDDGIVYFYVPSTGTGAPDKFFAYDKHAKKWVDGQHLKSGGGALKVNALSSVPNDTLPGPVAAPSSLVATAVSSSEIDLTWVNGDTAIDVTTEIYRDVTPGFTVGPGNLIATKTSGVASYVNNTGLSQITTYYYKIRHVRNAQNSANSNEANTKTWLAAPTGLDAVSLSNGVHLQFTNNAASADIDIERKSTGGYTVIATMTNQSTGAKTYDDTTGDCGTVYTYRTRAKKTGETTSLYSNEDSQLFCAAPPDITSASFLVSLNLAAKPCPSSPNITIIWDGTGFDSNDTCKIYQNDNGGGYVLVATVPITNRTYYDLWNKKQGSVNETIQYKLEAYDGGTSLSDTFIIAQQNYNVTDCGTA